jgi:hypothetical protein
VDEAWKMVRDDEYSRVRRTKLGMNGEMQGIGRYAKYYRVASKKIKFTL